MRSLISNAPYTVLNDFRVERPPQIIPKLIKNWFQNGTWGLYAKSDFENPLYSLKGFWGRGATPNWSKIDWKSVQKLIGLTSRVYMRSLISNTPYTVLRLMIRGMRLYQRDVPWTKGCALSALTEGRALQKNVIGA